MPWGEPEDDAGDRLQVVAIVPAYNEEATLTAVLAELRPQVDQVVVVSDGSTDATSRVARQAGATVIELPFNLGVGAALRAGLLLAHRQGISAAVQCDADGQHPPVMIPALLAGLEQADIVIGARFAGVGTYKVRGPRRWAMSFLALVISRLHHTRLTDVTSGFRAFSPRAVAVLSQEIPAYYLGDTVEVLIIAKERGLRVLQVPVEMNQRQGGVASSGPLRSMIYLVRATILMSMSLVRLGLRRLLRGSVQKEAR